MHRLSNRGLAGTILAAVSVVVAILAVSGPSVAHDDQDRTPTKAPVTKASQCLGYPLDQTQVVDRETLFAQDQHGRAALIKMKGPCLEPNEAVGFKYFGSTEICGPLDVDISGSVLTGIPQMCMIDSIVPLTKDQAKAYLHGK